MITRFEKTIDQAARLIGAENGDAVIVATTPHQQSLLVSSEIGRREVFVVYLDDVISQVYADVICMESNGEILDIIEMYLRPAKKASRESWYIHSYVNSPLGRQIFSITCAPPALTIFT